MTAPDPQAWAPPYSSPEAERADVAATLPKAEREAFLASLEPITDEWRNRSYYANRPDPGAGPGTEGRSGRAGGRAVMDSRYYEFPTGSAEHRAAYAEAFAESERIGFAVPDDVDLSYEADNAYELAAERYIAEHDAAVEAETAEGPWLDPLPGPGSRPRTGWLIPPRRGDHGRRPGMDGRRGAVPVPLGLVAAPGRGHAVIAPVAARAGLDWGGVNFEVTAPTTSRKEANAS
jgi:hypothetical protein